MSEITREDLAGLRAVHDNAVEKGGVVSFSDNGLSVFDALIALAERALDMEGETRVEWGVQYDYMPGKKSWYSLPNPDEKRSRAALRMAQRDPSAWRNPHIVKRTVTCGPWEDASA